MKGEIMNTEEIIYAGLKEWRKTSVGMEDADPAEGHLAVETLYLMATAGGMAIAAAADIEHLSLCPQCMQGWADWRRAISEDVAEDFETLDLPLIMTGGMLLREAAATAKMVEPVSTNSVCGRLKLSLLPRRDDPSWGMVTLEVSKGHERMFEGRNVTVRDYKKRTLLKGTIQQNRLARRIDRMDDVDLTHWSFICTVEDGNKEA